MGRYGSGDAQTGVTGADDGPVSELEDGDPIRLGQKKVGELLVFFLAVGLSVLIGVWIDELQPGL